MKNENLKNRRNMLTFVGSDDYSETVQKTIDALEKLNFQVKCYGAALNKNASSHWTSVAKNVSQSVQNNKNSFGILFCYTGTGVCIAANKFRGIRAALCFDYETAKGARKWNNANVLAMSLRLTTPTTVLEILDGWLSSSLDKDDKSNIECLSELEKFDKHLAL